MPEGVAGKIKTGAVAAVLRDARSQVTAAEHRPVAGWDGQLASGNFNQTRPETPASDPINDCSYFPFSRGGTSNRLKGKPQNTVPPAAASPPDLPSLLAQLNVQEPAENQQAIVQAVEPALVAYRQKHKEDEKTGKRPFLCSDVSALEALLWIVASECNPLGVRHRAAYELRMDSRDDDHCERIYTQGGLQKFAQVVASQLTRLPKSTAAANTDTHDEASLAIQVLLCLRNLYKWRKLKEQRVSSEGQSSHWADLAANATNYYCTNINTYPDVQELVAHLLWRCTASSAGRRPLSAERILCNIVRGLELQLKANKTRLPPGVTPMDSDRSEGLRRLAYALGALTHNSEERTQVLVEKTKLMQLLPEVLREHISSPPNDCETKKEKEANKVHNQTTGNLLRVIGNLAINCTAGNEFAESGVLCGTLVKLLHEKDVSTNEELVLNLMQCLTNITYYQDANNVLLERALDLVGPLSLLILHNHLEAVIEGTKAFGNLTRHAAVRVWMVEKRVDEAIVILLDHTDWTVLHATCGILLNFSADPKHCQLLSQFEALPKLIQRLDEFVAEPYQQAIPVAETIMKIFHNLVALDFFTDTGVVGDVCGVVSTLEKAAEASCQNAQQLGALEGLLHAAKDLLALMNTKWRLVITPASQPNLGELDCGEVGVGMETRPHTMDEFEELEAPGE
eukprot:TRINITY_DN112909_c0_g1_i1.p1 TRINITY_DN112909_c0_g1~~TRINITY_DN112909_c0_g1_i1.p1  ORF type:complete len:682 (+),score=42.02 TRINITY_DN112909_c0_g1_i1:51-2096(+)